MSLQDMLSALGFGGLTASEFVSIAELAMLFGSGILFLSTFVLCMMAFRATGAAQQARKAAETHFRSAQDLAVEVRHLTAQVEKSTARRTAEASVPASPVRVGALETTGEADVEIIADHAGEEGATLGEVETVAAAPEATAPSDPRLEEATRAASVPSALLMKRRRRRLF